MIVHCTKLGDKLNNKLLLRRMLHSVAGELSCLAYVNRKINKTRKIFREVNIQNFCESDYRPLSK